MEELLEIEEGYLRSDEYVNEIILSSEDKERIEQALCEIKSINSDNLEEIRQSILKVFEVKNINIDNPKIKSEIEEKIGADIRAF
jgi:septum formation topological specificity factor MinE